MTEAQDKAIRWLIRHGGDGVRQGKTRTMVLAAGETAPHAWSTFSRLVAAGLVEKYGTYRIRVTAAGMAKFS